MVDNKKIQGCVAPAAGPVSSDQPQKTDKNERTREERKMQAAVGKEAPDFEANAFHEGGFKTIKLSSFRGKWVFLCFYPGDFTFV